MHTRPSGSQVQYRRMRFSFEDDGYPRFWLDESPLKSLFWTQLSTAFEPGERFLMDSARGMRGELDDPGLIEELQDFCKQESHHIAQHLRFDAKNAQLGIDVDACRERFRAALARTTGGMNARRMLAFTVAGEHLTALLANMLLTREDLMRGADPGVKALWIWHAVEEAEHKATCFDIFLAIDGSYWERLREMPGALWFFTATSLRNSWILLRQAGQLGRWRTLRELGYLFGPRGLLLGFLPGLLEYLSPRFHPTQHDHSRLIREWQAQNAQLIVNHRDLAVADHGHVAE